ncbi:MAG: hypothetical protein LAP87_26630 [Acidobacteriia bacterium]|nr:hypothetical protein [Terriglobia bacterium]
MIFIDTSGGGRGDHQVPRRLEDPPGAERLPEGDIEFPSRRLAAHQAGHDYTLGHRLHYPLFRVMRARNRLRLQEHLPAHWASHSRAAQRSAILRTTSGTAITAFQAIFNLKIPPDSFDTITREKLT